MLSQTVNGLERRIFFKPAFHKVHEDPKKNYGVHGMEIWFLVIGDKGACHFGLSTGMMLPETFRYWKSKGQDASVSSIMQMGIDVGYHSKTPGFEGHQVNWPTKMRKTGPGPMDVEFDKIGDAPPICEYLGTPCYVDGSALRADDWKEIFLAEGDEPIWKMLEEDYKARFEDKTND